ncbi:hypothetical protein TNCV_2699991 [Trichonephila clavipes]|nr:hypothetical protein TNCV_2699991 [Trichonephila clavipes]
MLMGSPPRKFTCINCGGGDRGRVAIYRPFGEFRRAKIALSPVWCSRPTTGVPLAHATMNFVGLDLTTSDRWHQKTTTTRIVRCYSFTRMQAELESSAIRLRKGTMHVEYVETQKLSCWWGVEVRRGGCQLRCLPRHLTMVQKSEVCRQ